MIINVPSQPGLPRRNTRPNHAQAGPEQAQGRVTRPRGGNGRAHPRRRRRTDRAHPEDSEDPSAGSLPPLISGVVAQGEFGSQSQSQSQAGLVRPSRHGEAGGHADRAKGSNGRAGGPTWYVLVGLSLFRCIMGGLDAQRRALEATWEVSGSRPLASEDRIGRGGRGMGSPGSGEALCSSLGLGRGGAETDDGGDRVALEEGEGTEGRGQRAEG
ncbi:hypothetical protein B0T11DRAFT_131135 [Plectosphaerella cucumerina]|uniref:Uncharacterized protein n=1 Tax=Plectosphaerella cucumerina TaxID=40658 RepID=A0A8K0TBG8_9PEZI|nr:hypothetical protein B0T11DRAFT_131135 [Plectosphaerella cucumerina]